MGHDFKTADHLQVLWELDEKGRPCQIPHAHTSPRVARLRDMYAALRMLASGVYVWADFESESAEYQMSLTFQVRNSAASRFCAIYTLVLDDEEEDVPPFCIRVGGYSVSQKRILPGRVAFPATMHEDINTLLSDSHALALSSDFVPMPSNRPESDTIMYACLWSGGVESSISYGTFSYQCIGVERLCKRCFSMVSRALSDKGRIPSGPCMISYGPMIMQAIESDRELFYKLCQQASHSRERGTSPGLTEYDWDF